MKNEKYVRECIEKARQIGEKGVAMIVFAIIGSIFLVLVSMGFILWVIVGLLVYFVAAEFYIFLNHLAHQIRHSVCFCGEEGEKKRK